MKRNPSQSLFTVPVRSNQRLLAVGSILLSACVMLTMQTLAATVSLPFYDAFNYAEGNLNAVSGGNWVVGNGSTTFEIAVSNSAALTEPPGYVVAAGKGLRRSPSGTARRSVLQFPAASSGTLFISFLLNVQTAPGSAQIIVHLDNSSSSVTSPDLGIYVDNGPKVGVGKNSSSTPGFTMPNNLTPGTHLVVAAYTFLSGNDKADLWVDPSATDYGAALAPTPMGSYTNSGDPTQIEYCQIVTSSGSGGVQYIDELRIGTTWADVVPSGGPLIGAKLGFTTQPANAAPGATMSPVVVQVQTAGGASAPSNGVPVTLTLTAGSGTLSGTLTRNTDSAGKATFDDLSINTAGTGKQLTASASGIGAGLTAAVSSTFSIVVPSVGSKLAFTTQPANTPVNTTMAAVVVQIQDNNSVPVSSNNVPVTLTFVGTGNLSGTVTKNTDSTGKATFNDLAVDAVGAGDYFTADASGIGSGLAGATSGNFNITSASQPSGLNITQSSKNSSGFVVSGTNTAGGAFVQILGSPNLLLDQTNWLLVSYGNFDGNGAITFTNPTSAALPNAFYRLRTGNTDTKIQAPGLTAINNQTVPVGATASFSTLATAPLLQYLWLFNGNPIAGATTSALTIANAQVGNAGTYTVVVANPAGSASSSASLRVGNFAPSIVSGLQNVTATTGGDAVFNVIADGTRPLSYQWKDNHNVVISGETNSALTLHNVQTNQAGTYTVSVSNGIGSPATSSAALTVNAVPTAPPDTNMVGFAAIAGVTGGLGGLDVYATNYLSFSNYVRHTEALIIHVTNVITGPGPGVDQYCYIYGNNKTIIGEGTNAQVNGIDLRINATNIILANLLFQVTPVGTNDGVTIDGGSKGTGQFIWIDHCTVSNAQDGSIDVTKGADYVTISWCKFIYGPKIQGNVHEFVHLIGSSDSDGDANNLFHVTLHHNWYGTNAMERMPSVRWGRVHVYNCLYTASGNNYCARTRIGSQVLVERNFYQGVQNPWELYTTSGPTGLLLAVSNNIPYLSTAYGNTWVSGWTSGATTIPGTNSLSDFAPVPYAYTPNDTSDVPYYVQTYAGHGKFPYFP